MVWKVLWIYLSTIITYEEWLYDQLLKSMEKPFEYSKFYLIN